MKDKKQSIRHSLHEIVFEADTPIGKIFDVTLLVMIVLSVVVVMLESVEGLGDNPTFLPVFNFLEWAITILFTIEYLLRIWLTRDHWKYILSFYGLVDLLSIIPTYLSLIFIGTESLATIRALRLLRIFRVVKAAKYLSEASILYNSIRASGRKIAVFLTGVLTLVLIIGSAMYLIEDGAGSGFDSIPHSVYWAIVTVTTVGYGDIAPVTPLGQFLSAILMILGYGVLAVPTGIVSAEMVKASGSDDIQEISTQVCPNCSREGHDVDAVHCKYCGEEL